MARFIELTPLRRNNERFLLNIDCVEYMMPIAGNNGTALYSVSHHTKYEVKETIDEILTKMNTIIEIDYATKTSPITEVMDNENHRI